MNSEFANRMRTSISYLSDFCAGRLKQRTLLWVLIPLIGLSYFGSLTLAIWLFPGPFDWRTRGFESAVRLALSQGQTLREISDAAGELAEQIAMEEEGSVKSAASRLGLTDRALQMRRARRRPRFTASD